MAPIELLSGDEISAVESVKNFVDRIRTLWKTTRENLQKSVVKQARLYNKKHRPVESEVGDRVLLSTRNLAMKSIPAKLRSRLCGPFVVTEMIEQQVCRLEIPTNWLVNDVFHVSLLKTWRAASYKEIPRGQRIELEKTEPRYEVEKILRWRTQKLSKNRACKKYLVLWSGYPMEEASWIPDENFDDQTRLQEHLQCDKPQEEN